MRYNNQPVPVPLHLVTMVQVFVKNKMVYNFHTNKIVSDVEFYRARIKRIAEKRLNNKCTVCLMVKVINLKVDDKLQIIKQLFLI